MAINKKKIILLRHGKVDIKDNKNISANQFGEWIIEYNNSDVISEFALKNEIEGLLGEADILICSSLISQLL